MKNIQLKDNTGLLADILLYLEKNNISLMKEVPGEVKEACCKELQIKEETWPDSRYHLISRDLFIFDTADTTKREKQFMMFLNLMLFLYGLKCRTCPPNHNLKNVALMWDVVPKVPASLDIAYFEKTGHNNLTKIRPSDVSHALRFED